MPTPTPSERSLEEVEDCPFCAMVKKFTGKVVFDIEPLNPVVPGHRLIIPAEHVSNFSDNSDLTAAVMKYAAEYAKRHGIDCNLITSKGSPATQTVFHLHVHIVPRRDGDGLLLPWTGQQALDQREQEVWKKALEAVRYNPKATDTWNDAHQALLDAQSKNKV